MNQKTERAIEISMTIRRLLIAVTLITLVLVFATEGRRDEGTRLGSGYQFTLYPWLHAAALTQSHSIDAFSGRPSAPFTAGQKWSMLAGVLLSLVIAPTLLLFGWKYSALRKEGRAPASAGMALMFVGGGILAIAVAFPSIPFAYETVRAFETTRQAHDLGSHRDRVIHQLLNISRQARQHRILPASAGGGNGSFRTFVIPQALQASPDALVEVAHATPASLELKATSKVKPSFITRLSIQSNGVVSYSFEGF